MCIRDRSQEAVMNTLHDTTTNTMTDFVKKTEKHCSNAVSYTHLDVYKRQEREPRGAFTKRLTNTK